MTSNTRGTKTFFLTHIRKVISTSAQASKYEHFDNHLAAKGGQFLQRSVVARHAFWHREKSDFVLLLCYQAVNA